MPVLGSGGRVIFKRPLPPSVDLPQPEDFIPSCNAFNVNCPGLWNGDLVCVEGLPTAEKEESPHCCRLRQLRWQPTIRRTKPYHRSTATPISSTTRTTLSHIPGDQFGDDADFYASQRCRRRTRGTWRTMLLDWHRCPGAHSFLRRPLQSYRRLPGQCSTTSELPTFESLTLMPAGMLDMPKRQIRLPI